MKLDVIELLVGLMIYILAIYVHEFGHYVIAVYYGKLVKVNMDTVPEIVYSTNNKGEEFQILMYGIILGFIVLYVYAIHLKQSYGLNGLLLSLLFFTGYLFGCTHDLTRLHEL